jgi:phosphate:Na+ symporter
VLLVVSPTAKGVVPLTAALALIIGAIIGSAINPVIEGANGGDAVGRRLAIGNLLIRVTGALVALPLLGRVGPFLAERETSLACGVADFHTSFNVALALSSCRCLDYSRVS